MADLRAEDRELLSTLGAERHVGANSVRTVGADHAWYVVAGRVSLFLQRVAEGAETDHLDSGHLDADRLDSHDLLHGRRRFIASVEAGSLLWPGRTWTAPPGWRLIGVPEPDTVVRDIVAERLPSDAAERGALGFAHLVVTAVKPTSTETTSTETPATASPAENLASALTEVVRQEIEADAVAERSAAASRAATSARLDDAVRSLGGVTATTTHTVVREQREMVARALARLGTEIGVDVPELAPEVDDAKAVLAELCRTTGIRRRTVTLEPGWTSQTGVPFLAYADRGRRPVAVYVRRGRWVRFDPADGTERRIDDEVAANLSPTADALYPPLPEGPVSARSLARFAIHQSRPDFRLLFAAGALAGLLGLAIPIAVSIVYDSVIPADDGWLLVSVIAMLLGAGATATLASLSRNLALVRIQGVVQARADPAVIDRLLRIDSGEMRDWTAGDVANRIIGLQRIRNQLSGSVATAFLTLLFSTMSLLLIFVYSLLLGVVATAALAIAVWVLALLIRSWVRWQRESFDHAGRVSALMFEAVGGIAKLRIAGAQQRLVARWAEEYGEQQRAQYAAGRYRSWITALTTALPVLAILPVYIVAGAVAGDELSPGRFLAAITALGQLTGAVVAVSLSLSSVLVAVPLWRRLEPVLTASLEPRGQAPSAAQQGRIEVVGVRFAYEGGSTPILDDVSIVAEPGQLVALTGPSGAGKSTLLRIILGLERPDEGSVLFDGVDSTMLDMAAVRRRIGVVSQNVRPIPGSIEQIITGTRAGAEEAAWAAAQAAGLADDIRRMPMGMQTIVSEQGGAFSGGQIQRLMIARALARRPSILLFDEATSALDGKTQADVSERLAALAVTRIVIAHRLSTIRDADRIYVLDEGSIVEHGTYDELMERNGEFARLAHRQLA